MIEIEAPDGTIVEFPAGTSDDTITRVMREAYGGPQQTAAPQERGLLYRIGDNVLGFDDGVQSFGEKAATWLNMAGESMTMGLVGEEADAALRGVIAAAVPGGRGYSETYADRRDFLRGNEAQMREEHPVMSFGADVTGAMVPGAGLVGAIGKGANLLTRSAIGGGLGAIGGATAGFMEGEGGGGARIANMLPAEGASVANPLTWGPAAIGTVAGALVPGAGALAGAGYRAFGGGSARQLRQARGSLGLDDVGAEFAADAVARDAPFAGRNLAEAGPNAIAAEMGPNSQSLLNWAINRPGGASSQAAARVEDLTDQRGQAFRDTLDDVLGDRMGVTARQTQLMQDTAAGRRGAYDTAYAQPIDYASEQGRALEGLLQRIPPAALRRAREMMQVQGVQSRQVLFRELPDGTFAWERLPDVREMDLITRALNDMRDPFSGAGPTQRSAYAGLASEIRDTLDRSVPEYGAARAAGGDAIANREAMEFGASLLDGRTVPLDVALATIRRMGAAERTFAAQGVRDFVGEVMGNVQRLRRQGGNREAIQQAIAPVSRMLTEDGQAKLVALLGPDEAERLLQSAREVHSAVVLRNGVARGSDTQPRQAWEGRLDDAHPVTPSEALQQGRGVSGALAAALRPLAGDPAAGRNAAKDSTLEAIVNVLMSPASGQGSRAVLPALQSLPRLLAQTASTAGRIKGGTQEMAAIIAALMAQQQAQR